MLCDVSQGGSVMECPTCFQKIVAPQAPAPDAKFILTGTQLAEKKIHVRGLESAGGAGRKKSLAPTLLLVAALAVALGAGVYFFGGNWFGPRYAWSSVDVGSAHPPGKFSQAGGKITVAGAGDDIWFQNDAFHFACVRLDGDGAITARVLNQLNTDPWAKAGVMFRATLKPGSPFALAAVTPGNGVTFQVRSDADGQATAPRTTSGIAAPRWLRLTRDGNTFTAESSPDGKAWTTLSSAKVSMPARVFVGLAVCSHHNGVLCSAQFDRVTIQGNINGSAPSEKAAPTKTKPAVPPANAQSNAQH